MSFEVLPFGHQFAVFDAANTMIAGPFIQRQWAAKRRKQLMQAAGLIDPAPVLGVRRKCMCCPAEFASDGPHNRLCPHCRHHVGGHDRQMVS